MLNCKAFKDLLRMGQGRGQTVHQLLELGFGVAFSPLELRRHVCTCKRVPRDRSEASQPLPIPRRTGEQGTPAGAECEQGTCSEQTRQDAPLWVSRKLVCSAWSESSSFSLPSAQLLTFDSTSLSSPWKSLITSAMVSTSTVCQALPPVYSRALFSCFLHHTLQPPLTPCFLQVANARPPPPLEINFPCLYRKGKLYFSRSVQTEVE